MKDSRGVESCASARDVWDFFVGRGGLQVRTYDRGLVETLGSALGLGPVNTAADFRAELDAARIPVEGFIEALFAALEPFTLMMSELYGFFERHDVRRTGQGLRLRFVFDDAGNELTFDLRHFRELLSIWEEAFATLEVEHWDYSTIWRPFSILRDYVVPTATREDRPTDPDAQAWIEMNEYPGRERAERHWTPPPAPPPLGVPEVDRWVLRVHQLVAQVAEACAPFGNYKTLRATPGAREQLLIRRAEDRAPLSDWPPSQLSHLESDFFSGTTLNFLWLLVDRLRALPRSEVLPVAAGTVTALEDLFSSLPTTLVDRKLRMERFEEFLNLPAWKHRHGLYQAWMLPVVEEALAGYPMELHDDHGTLSMSFSASRMATIATVDGPIELIAELRTPLASPTGKHRKENIQPDYVLARPSTNGAGTALAVIEMKQYLRPNVRLFAAALEDYARGHPDAVVILSDYGPMSSRVLERVSGAVRDRALAVGEVRPGSRDAVRAVQAAIRGSLPRSPEPDSVPPEVAAGVHVVVVDVSASMDDALATDAVIGVLGRLSERLPSATWLAADESIRLEVSGPSAVGHILALPRNHGTSLQDALRGRDLGNVVVITDDDGRDQLARLPRPPAKVGIVSGSTIAWLTELRDNVHQQ